MPWGPILLLIIGAYLCLLNGYLQWLRPRILRRQGRYAEAAAGTSGVPILGTVLVVLTMPAFGRDPWGWGLAFILVGVDAGGPHWLWWRHRG